MRERKFDGYARVIQKAWRKHHAREQYLKQKKKVLMISRKTFTNSTLVIHKVAYHVCRLILTKFELHHEKTRFLHVRKQRRRSATIHLISAFTVAALIVQSLYFLNPKFQASSHLLWLHSPVCIRPGQKPQRQAILSRGSHVLVTFSY